MYTVSVIKSCMSFNIDWEKVLKNNMCIILYRCVYKQC